jgi:hypothetical protein
MKNRWNAFNIYLLAALGLLAICGCASEDSKHKKVFSTLRVHFEGRRDVMGKSEEVMIGRDHPVKLIVEKVPFLNEGFVKQAKVIDVLGGFELQLQFDRDGSMLLEQYTTANPGRHLAIFCEFMMPPEEKLNGGRWLAAPRISAKITDGILRFTPDASREEVDQIVLGLNNIAKKLETGQEPKW